MLGLDDHLTRACLRIGEGLLVVVDRAGRYARGVEAVEPRMGRLRERHRFDQLDQFAPMAETGLAGGKAVIADPFRVAEHLGGLLPEPIGKGTDRDVAVARANRLVRRAHPVGGSQRAGNAPARPQLRGLPGTVDEACLEQARVDPLATPGAGSSAQRREDAERAERASADVRERHARLGRVSTGLTRDAHDPGCPLHDDVVAPAFGIRPGCAKAGDRCVHEPGIDLGERLVANPEPLRGSRPVALDQDVSGSREPVQDVAAALVLEVDTQAALVPVDGQERSGFPPRLNLTQPAARRVPDFRWLDLDHVGAVIGEQHGAVRAGHHLRSVDDTQTGKRRFVRAQVTHP